MTTKIHQNFILIGSAFSSAMLNLTASARRFSVAINKVTYKPKSNEPYYRRFEKRSKKQ